MLIGKNISKKFAGITALDNVTLELHPGQVNAIIGENGAGKSTLMKILSGVYTDYGGEIELNNKRVHFSNVREAEQAGIVIIHQELNLVPGLSITENIFLGKELTNAVGLLDKPRMEETATALLKRVALTAKPNDQVASLRTGQQQLVEIAKALLSDASVIIMDEPTSAISDKEIATLFDIVRTLKSEGKTIVYISHKFKELFEIADRYTVLRDGQTVASGMMKDMSAEMLVQKMAGRELSTSTNTLATDRGKELLQVQNLSWKPSLFSGKKSLRNISFSLHAGEIVGLYGLMGSGRSELLETIFGLHTHRSSGNILVKGKPCKISSPSDAIRCGLALVPEDRKRQGLILQQSVRNNITITILQQLQRWKTIIHRGKEQQFAEQSIDKLGIKTTSGKVAAMQLSGGNQQKIVLAKWLATKPVVLLLDEPTRGIDINAKHEIYKLMRELAANGLGIIMASSEMPEILAVSQRVWVMSEGELTADMPVAEASENNMLKFAIAKN